ncbi:MAG: hypothetical protein ACLFT6_07155 [Bacteroidales bacterium]
MDYDKISAVKKYIQQSPRTRTEVIRKFHIKAKKLDEIMDYLINNTHITSRRISTEGRKQTVYLETSGHSEINPAFLRKVEIEKARRIAQKYINKYSLKFPECGVPECDNKATHIRHPNPNIPYAVTFLCSECNDFLRDSELNDFANITNLKDLRQKKPRTPHAARQYLRQYMERYAIEIPVCQICGSDENVRRHIPDPQYPKEANFVCAKCMGKIIHTDELDYPKPINVDTLLLS